jgi:hypothetical protein
MRTGLPRLIAFPGAVVGWAALVLQFVLLVRVIRGQGGTFPLAVWRFVGFFTILSNIAASCVLTRAALWPAARGGLNAPRVELAVATAMAMVGIVYSALLRALWNPQGWQMIADIALHDVMPVLFVIFYLLRSQRGLAWRDVGAALVFPLGYCVYALARGAVDGWYAYPFLNPVQLSGVRLIANILGLSLAFALAALVLLALGRALAGPAGREPAGREH